jgi:MFS-type transporter involved in bile tolerance (Atg22 family)
MALRDFDPIQLEADQSAILAQAGITFSYFGTAITGIWSSSRTMFGDFEDQRRDDVRFTVFFTTSQISGTPAPATTCVRAGVTYFVEQVRFDAEGTGCEIDVAKVI